MMIHTSTINTRYNLLCSNTVFVPIREATLPFWNADITISAVVANCISLEYLLKKQATTVGKSREDKKQMSHNNQIAHTHTQREREREWEYFNESVHNINLLHGLLHSHAASHSTWNINRPYKRKYFLLVLVWECSWPILYVRNERKKEMYQNWAPSIPFLILGISVIRSAVNEEGVCMWDRRCKIWVGLVTFLGAGGEQYVVGV